MHYDRFYVTNAKANSSKFLLKKLTVTAVFVCAAVSITIKYIPSKHERLTQCWPHVATSSATLTQHKASISSTFRAYCVGQSLKQSPVVVPIVSQCRRRWASIETILAAHHVFDGPHCHRNPYIYFCIPSDL